MKDRRNVKNIIEALSRHQDPDSIRVLNEVGTNSAIDEVREMTSRLWLRKMFTMLWKLLFLIKVKVSTI